MAGASSPQVSSLGPPCDLVPEARSSQMRSPTQFMKSGQSRRGGQSSAQSPPWPPPYSHTPFVFLLLHFLISYFTLLSKSLLLAKFKLTRQSRKWSPGSITKNHTCTNWAQKNDLRYVLRNKALFQPCVLFATRMSLKEASPYSMWTAAL